MPSDPTAFLLFQPVEDRFEAVPSVPTQFEVREALATCVFPHPAFRNRKELGDLRGCQESLVGHQLLRLILTRRHVVRLGGEAPLPASVKTALS